MTASNKEKIYERYGGGSPEDGRENSSRTAWLEFHYTKKALSEFIKKDSRVLETGCATGYYAMHFAGKCREYVGVDLFPPHIRLFNKKIKQNRLKNVSCRVGDATDLKGIETGGFDAVFCLGPMYHLPPEERELVFAECGRVCKPGGVTAFAYINKIGVYAGACVHDEYREIYPNPKTDKAVFELGTDDERPGLFYFTMPEEMEEAAARHGLAKIRNTGLDFFVTMSVADKMDDEKFAVFMELADKMAEYESCTGMSNHALLICRK
ncbi:MAG: class I SAM-dependent methyltransferase [Oscillospiraceae bacterium]|nr:class I SAM-dependent methyltransferase [Oscillospiraceae bacterium]